MNPYLQEDFGLHSSTEQPHNFDNEIDSMFKLDGESHNACPPTIEDEASPSRTLRSGFPNRTTPQLQQANRLDLRDQWRAVVSCRMDVFMLGKTLLSPPSPFESLKFASQEYGCSQIRFMSSSSISRAHPSTLAATLSDRHTIFQAPPTNPPTSSKTLTSTFKPCGEAIPPFLFSRLLCLSSTSLVQPRQPLPPINDIVYGSRLAATA
ncbi:hypothetical protein NLJ89_g11983 [Agrocybe chaxingu]|uniref:Uncharacterized protein n=1 Tax=Agrocybe chaxingu TaxID=84603 RepID=A0A9W8MMJ9_9AGAR|nr:hypothetical protein NLJ89_g11983 [Agrocybe chaxingu]